MPNLDDLYETYCGKASELQAIGPTRPRGQILSEAAIRKWRIRISAFSVLALGLAAITGCAEGPGVVTFEGTVADELVLEGSGYVRAHRDSVFCKRNLLQQPTLKSVSVKGKFRRLPGGRYKLEIDLRNAPIGGFCDWRLAIIGVEAAPSAGPNITMPVASFCSEAELIELFSAPPNPPLSLPPAAEMSSSCRHGEGVEARFISCVLIDHLLPDFVANKRFALNVRYQQGHGDPSIDP